MFVFCNFMIWGLGIGLFSVFPQKTQILVVESESVIDSTRTRGRWVESKMSSNFKCLYDSWKEKTQLLFCDFKIKWGIFNHTFAPWELVLRGKFKEMWDKMLWFSQLKWKMRLNLLWKIVSQIVVRLEVNFELFSTHV